MARQGNGYWIQGSTGKIAKVDRHERWLMNKKNLQFFGLENLASVLSEFNPETDQDEIRVVGMQAGLIRTRDNQGTISIQFYAPRGKVSDYLYNTAQALMSVNDYGLYVWLNNLMYDETQTVTWKQFIEHTTSAMPIMVHEEKGITADDVPSNKPLLRQIARKLRLAGLG